MRIKFNIWYLLKWDITPIFVLLSILIITRLLLIINAPVIYHFDSYAYLLEAIDFSSTGKIQIDVGMPFIFYLGVLYYIFGSTLGTILFTRLSMLLISALLVCIIYLFGLKMSGKIFGFLAALLVIFEPFFLCYSIVPHNDVFSAAIGLTALYYATSNTTLCNFFLSPLFFYILVATRPELFLVFIIPMLIFYFLKHLKIGSVQSLIKFLIFTAICVFPAIWLYPYAQSYTRFEVIEKFALFLTPELLKKTLYFSFAFYDQNIRNQVIFTFVVLSLALGFYYNAIHFFNFERKGKTFSIKYKKDTSIKEIFFSDQTIIAFCMFLVFFVNIIVLTAYAYEYIIVDGTIIVNQRLPDRYLILPRLLIVYPLAYAFSKVVKKV